jgi:hypothetical protein
MQEVRVIQRPTSRGRFSHQRDVWDCIHKDRFNRWLEGAAIEDIAEAHGVTCRSVHLSISGVLARLHRKYRIQAIGLRDDNRNAWKVQFAALEEYRALMNPNTRIWKTAPSSRQPTGERNFERLLDYVKALHKELGS